MEAVCYQVALQVRLGSKRLAGKALLPMGGKAHMLELCLANLRRSKLVERFVLLTCHQDYDELAPIAERFGFACFAGAEDNVLERFWQALERYPATYCLRATGDNPLSHGGLADLLIEASKQGGADYYWMRGLPYGLGLELFRSEALFSLQQRPLSPENREHVTQYLYQNPQFYRIIYPSTECMSSAEGLFLGEALANLRVTVDTQEDYQNMQELYSRLSPQDLERFPALLHFLCKYSK